MYRIVGLQLHPVVVETIPENKYHIEVIDIDGTRVFCNGYIFAEVQNHVFQNYQFSIDLYNESDKEVDQDEIASNEKLRSIINAVCGIMFNNSI